MTWTVLPAEQPSAITSHDLRRRLRCKLLSGDVVEMLEKCKADDTLKHSPQQTRKRLQVSLKRTVLTKAMRW